MYGALIGAGLSMVQSNANQRQSDLNAKKNFERQKEYSNFLHGLSMKQWNDTNYTAQMEHLKKAGLNPALMYAQGGQGGSTGNFSSSVEQGQSHFNMSGIQTGLQIEAQKAQIDNIKADTAAKEADADKKGVEIKSLTQGIENQKTINELNKVQTELLNIGVKKENETFESYIERFEAETNKLLGEAEIALSQAHVDTNTRNEKIKIIQNEAINTLLQGKLTMAQTQKLISDIELNNAQILKLDHDKLVDWDKLNKEQQRILIEATKTKIQEEYPNIWNVAGGQALRTSEAINMILGKALGKPRSLYPSRNLK